MNECSAVELKYKCVLGVDFYFSKTLTDGTVPKPIVMGYGILPSFNCHNNLFVNS